MLIFMGIIWTDVCARWSCIPKSRFYCTISCAGVSNIFDIMRHLYKIIFIGFLWSLCSFYPSTVLGVFSYGVSSGWFSVCPSFLLVHVALWYPLTTLYPCVLQYTVGFNFDSYSFPVVASPPCFFWYPMFSVLVCSARILSVYASCLMVLVSWLSTSFSKFVDMARLSSALNILYCIVMAMLASWNLAWIVLMYCS